MHRHTTQCHTHKDPPTSGAHLLAMCVPNELINSPPKISLPTFSQFVA